MNNLRKYGKAPFNLVVVHGGPGAPGYMAPVARELSLNWGVLEPLQTAGSLEGQIQELRFVLEKNGDLPVFSDRFILGGYARLYFFCSIPKICKKTHPCGECGL